VTALIGAQDSGTKVSGLARGLSKVSGVRREVKLALPAFEKPLFVASRHKVAFATFHRKEDEI